MLEKGRVPLIIDCGANNGASALWFASRFPAARVVAVEPDDENAEICRINTRGRRIDVLQAAIGSTPGAVSISDADAASWAVQTHRDAEGRIPVATIQDIVSTYGPDAELFLVKVDIEGFESDLFATGTEWMDDVRVLLIEPHDWLLPDRATSRNFQTVTATQGLDVLISGDTLVYVR